MLSTLHSGIGESGDVQGMLDYMGVVYTGSGVFPTHTCSDKVRSTSAWRTAPTNADLYLLPEQPLKKQKNEVDDPHCSVWV